LSPGAVGPFENAVAPPAAPTTPAAAPNSAIAAPADRLPTLAPLSQSQPVDPQTLGAGGTATLPSSTPLSTSPSQAAPSVAGGGGRTLADCMRFWDKETHMSKSEWQAACQRSLHRLDSVARELAPTRAR
jgi:hypothetical protein